ncbi:MAG: zinc ribbon domain-containing protein [Rhizobiales bacterium]|nr:zinc ribbon domain-containing protein [Hyphomicrobiales bacterium]
MLAETEDERELISSYLRSQAPDLEIVFMQKIYSEHVLNHIHDVWDIHTHLDRWWVITNPTNLYSQAQFPNLDYAVTFHIGLCLRIPRSLQQRPKERSIVPFGQVFSDLEGARAALSQAVDVPGYQAVGMRSREALLSLISVAQDFFRSEALVDVPKRGDFKNWSDLIYDRILAGRDQKDRRRLFKAISKEAWDFSAWLTHAKSATWRDAEACLLTVDHVVGLASSLIVMWLREVPEACPQCGSPKLEPEEGRALKRPELVWERPVCTQCGWSGNAIPIGEDEPDPELIELVRRYGGPDGPHGCVVPDTPLIKLEKPGA